MTMRQRAIDYIYSLTPIKVTPPEAMWWRLDEAIAFAESEVRAALEVAGSLVQAITASAHRNPDPLAPETEVKP